MSREASSSSSPAEEADTVHWDAREAAAARLEKMVRGEDELSEEQIQANNKIQEDELLALQAIYGMIWFSSTTMMAFISLHYQLSGDVRVYLNVCFNGKTETGADDESDRLLYACNLQHLPPVVLTCLLPRSYPSHRAPYFVVAAKWLDEPEVSSFCSVLDEIWAEQQPAGQEVVYRWVDWLSTSSWSCIASDDQIVLGPDADSAGGDDRAIGRSRCFDSIIPLIQPKRDHMKVLLKASMSEETSSKLPCGHSFCVKCMETQCVIHVKEGSVTSLTCPDTSCRRPLPSAVMRGLLSDGDYARWESLVLRRMLDTMPDVVYCPRCSAACVAADDDAQCSGCFFTFCAVCRERRHVDGTCVPPIQQLDILLERQMEKRPSAAAAADRLSEQRRMEELLSLREVIRTSRQCPSCKMAVSKTMGCNKMVCTNCGRPFCYRCCKPISGYDHFGRECNLFDRISKRWLPGQPAWVNLDYDFDEIAETSAWVRAIRYPCPICGAKRTKSGNNDLLLCRVCRTQYCALCSKKSSERSGMRARPPLCAEEGGDELREAIREERRQASRAEGNSNLTQSISSLEDEGQVSSCSPVATVEITEMSRELSSSSVLAEEADAGHWDAREETAARLEKMVYGENELSEEQIQANDQIQEDEDAMEWRRKNYDVSSSASYIPSAKAPEQPLGRPHSSCVKCMETQCGIHVREGSLTRLTCADTSCRRLLPPAVLRGLLDDCDYARWESLVLRRMLDTMPDVVYCPRCSAACITAGDDAQCSGCFFTFCAVCRERRHVGDSCVDPNQKLNILLERQKEERPADSHMLAEKRKIEELLSLREVIRSSRQCPSCKMAVSKKDGCNKMVCGNCGQFLCFRCGKAIGGYDHFNGKCGLFDSRWVSGQPEWMNLGYDYDEIMEVTRRPPAWIRSVRYPCPSCCAKRTKSGNNDLLVCRRCRTQYCARCSKRVWIVAEHYEQIH
uniref:RBR-type E3 ubiquitin transferase n=1 Tax=Leersia perrieri TaxID=77586 RepID=A0A0D9VJR8_9ORYZ